VVQRGQEGGCSSPQVAKKISGRRPELAAEEKCGRRPTPLPITPRGKSGEDPRGKERREKRQVSPRWRKKGKGLSKPEAQDGAVAISGEKLRGNRKEWLRSSLWEMNSLYRGGEEGKTALVLRKCALLGPDRTEQVWTLYYEGSKWESHHLQGEKKREDSSITVLSLRSQGRQWFISHGARYYRGRKNYFFKRDGHLTSCKKKETAH